MTEVLDRLKAEVKRLRLALERATMELVSAKESEADARPGTSERAFREFARAQFALDAWSLECQLASAVAVLKVKEGEVEHEEFRLRLRGNPTVAWADERRKRFEEWLEEGRRAAREMVAEATDEQAAKRRLEEARQRRKDELRQEQEQEQELGM